MESIVHSALQGLYAITPDTRDSAWLLPRVEAVLQGGASLVQYRSKSPDTALRLQQARAIQQLCRQHAALFIINDDLPLASHLGADGIHLGRHDPELQQARHHLGQTAIIGASCYNQYALAHQAARAGADYLALGALFTSRSKPDVVRAPPTLVAGRPALGLPYVVIGGIDADNAAQAWACGTEMLAVIGGLFMATDPGAAARTILAARRPQAKAPHGI